MQRRLRRNHLAGGKVASRAFVTAHLFTGDAQEAVRVTVEAIHSWDFEEGTGGILVRTALVEATRLMGHAGAESNDRDLERAYLPVELRRVIVLPAPLRYCFVMHALAALPLMDCARMLNMHCSQVVECLVAACKRLSNTTTAEESIMHSAFLDHATNERLAYQLWEERGCPLGSPEDDWFRAQEQLRSDVFEAGGSGFSLSMDPES